MATYFDPEKESHLQLLPKSVRDNPEVEVVAANVEAEVIDQYTRHGGARDLDRPVPRGSRRPATQVGDSGYWVFLRGYEEDPADVDTDEHPNFKDDLAATIARVVRWRLSQDKLDPGVVSENDERGKTRTRVSDFRRRFPVGWDSRLRKYDTREPGWGW